MLKRIRPSIGSAHVIALLALFAALGGGYATAFSGSGTVQKAGKVGITAADQDVRTLTGIGAVGANCIAGGLALRFRNNSGETLTIEGWNNGTGAEISVNNISSNNTFTGTGLVTGISEVDFHVSPSNGSKTPQADVRVTGNETGDCSTSTVTVLALNTQE